MIFPGDVKLLCSWPDDDVLTLEKIISIGKGNDAEWGRYLRGARSAALISRANTIIKKTNRQFVSIRGEEWRQVTVLAAVCMAMDKRLRLAGRRIKNTEAELREQLDSSFSTRKNKDDIRALIQLIEADPEPVNTYAEWSLELLHASKIKPRAIK